ncbi:MAG TPA: NAD-dependent epimerase/dehydratase family protein, partial [Candidatus Sulfomarinibacteraceae bacterium]|nr:NAD-dependent epimerase/dehydratase family protein [Candidatus Sulfomarinibacteraceae bacterium]
MNATIIGGTGLVGSHLLRLLLDDERFTSVVALGRRPIGVAHAKLRDAVVDFRAPESFAALVAGDVLFSALGTTIGAARSQAAQREVDHGIQLRVAQAARRNGVPALVLVS